MDRLGLSHDDLHTYHQGLLVSHERRITVSVLDMDGNTLARLDTCHPRVAATLTGQVSVDADSTPARTLTLSFEDPHGALGFDPSSPAATGLHVSRQIRVTSSRYIDTLGWISCRIFTGPVRAFDASNGQVSLTAYSRDALGTGSLWSAFSAKKGALKTTVIRDLLGRYGESRFDIPANKSRLPKHLALGRSASPWPHAAKLAHSMNRQLFYTGSGVATLRAKPGHAVLTLDDFAKTIPSAQRSLEGVYNAVRVIGGKPKGHKTRVQATAVLHPNHDLSPSGLAPTGGHVYLPKEIHNPHVRSHAEAQRLADSHLADSAVELVTVSMDCVPIDHLQELDMLRAGGVVFRLRQFTIPISLDGSAPTTIGTLKRTTRA